MAYKVYRKEKSSDKVELVNKEVYETREEAEMAMREAQETEKEKNQKIPFPGEVFGPGQTTVPGDKLVEGEDLAKEDGDEFFIREV